MPTRLSPTDVYTSCSAQRINAKMLSPNMNIHVYLDHNIVDDISKGELSLKPSDKVIWIYSHENLGEIRRSGKEDRFLDALESIKARKQELTLDGHFRMTGEAQILKYRSPHEEYSSYLEAISDCEIDQSSDIEFIARLFGAENKKDILSHPASFESNIRTLLEPHGLYDEKTKKMVEKVRYELTQFVNGPLQDVGSLETTREALGTHKGRAGNLAGLENPIEAIWHIVKKSANRMSPDQYFGFDPIDKKGYESWPLFLGIVGCHTMLNVLGFRPDDGLTKTTNIPGILSDGSHIGHAAYCQGLLSRDIKLLAKARAIYRYKNIATQVLSFEPK